VGRRRKYLGKEEGGRFVVIRMIVVGVRLESGRGSVGIRGG
jgi:hypothetical protein